MQNIKRIGMRECVGTPKFALYHPCAIIDEIGVVLKVTTEARTDNLIGDYIMRIPDGWIALETSKTENIGKQGEHVVITSNGMVTFGKKILKQFTEKDFGNLTTKKEMPQKVCVLKHDETRNKNQIMFAFGTPQEMDALREAQGSNLKDYQWNKKKEGFTAKGALRRLEIKEIQEIFDPSKSTDWTLYEWTETRHSQTRKADVVIPHRKHFLVKDSERVTSVRFTKSKVDPESGTIIVSTKDMEYNTKDLQRQDEPNKRSFSKVLPVTKDTG